MTLLALNMPWAFVLIYGVIMCGASKWRLTAYIICMTALVNIAFKGFFWQVSEAVSPVLTTYAFYSIIDILTAAVLIYAKPFKGRRWKWGKRAAKGQASIILLAVGFNAVVYCNYAFNKYMLDSDKYFFMSVYVPVILLLNITQILLMGSDLYGRKRLKRLALNFGNRSVEFIHSFRWGVVATKKHKQASR